jgi:hypothetical protein
MLNYVIILWNNIHGGKEVKKLGARFLKIAVVYFIIAIGFGIYASSTQDFRFTGVHAHVALLGWASLALSGLIYHLFPKAANHVLGKLHFWLHNIGLPFMMLFLVILISTGNVKWEYGIIPSAILVALGVICLLINVFMNVSDSKQISANSSKDASM